MDSLDWYAQRDLPRLDLDIAVWVYRLSTVKVPKPILEGKASAQNLDQYDDNELRRVQSKDLSGGGMLVYFDDSQAEYIRSVIANKEKLGLTFFIPDPEHPAQVRAISEIRWCEDPAEEEKKGIRIGCRFIRIRPADKDLIINYVIKKMIEKGLEER